MMRCHGCLLNVTHSAAQYCRKTHFMVLLHIKIRGDQLSGQNCDLSSQRHKCLKTVNEIDRASSEGEDFMRCRKCMNLYPYLVLSKMSEGHGFFFQ